MKTPTTALLVVIAALLAVNLIINLSPQVGANPPRTALSGDDDEAVLVGISVTGSTGGTLHVLRLWSDGVVEVRVATNGGNPSGPVYWHPTIIPEWVEVVP